MENYYRDWKDESLIAEFASLCITQYVERDTDGGRVGPAIKAARAELLARLKKDAAE